MEGGGRYGWREIRATFMTTVSAELYVECVDSQSQEAIGIGAELLAADGGAAFGSRRFDHYCSFSEYVGREDASGCKPW